MGILVAAAGGVTALLVAFSGGYGYHRDELYFIAAGRRLDWAYADQGPLTPLIARAMTEIAPDSLLVLRLPSAVAAGLTVLLTGLLARELGARPRGVAIAAATAGVASIVLFTGHLLSTSTFDLLTWTAVTWLVVRAVRSGNGWLWVVAGLTLGIGLLNKPLPAFLAAGILVGVVLSGPRTLLRSPYVWGGAAVAVALWAPWLIWQAGHGWPQLEVSRSIAAGGSASSEPWWAVIPFQFLLVGPPLAPVWIAGLVRLFRDPGVRPVRFLGWAWVVLAAVFMATGGKPYYLAGLLPVLIAAGARPVDEWLARGRTTARKAAFGVALASAAVVDAVIALPVLPPDLTGPVVAVNEDVGATIGWPEFVADIAEVYPDGAVIFTANYGEAGAVDRFGPAHGLPRAYSGHNAYGDWGPPPDGNAPVLTVGIRLPVLEEYFRGCAVVEPLSEPGLTSAVDVAVCGGPRQAWSKAWTALRHLG